MKIASVERIVSVEKHPNADTLNVCTVLGYNIIVKNDRPLTVGDLVVFIQPDTILPDLPWSQSYNRSGKVGDIRVKAIKLRDIWSMGIIEDLNRVVPDFDPAEIFQEGQEISERIGVVKYEPPPPQELHAKGNLPFGLPKTDEERYQNIGRKLPMGEKCDVTLKVDGSSWTAYCGKSPDGEWKSGVCGRTLECKLDCDNNYTKINTKYKILEKLEAFCRSKDISLALRGEMYGNGLQSMKINPHCTKPLDIAFYSVYIINERRYARVNDPLYFIDVCAELNLPTVPILERGVILTPELIKKYDEDLANIDGVPFEGVVINHSLDSFKVINKQYDSKK